METEPDTSPKASGPTTRHGQGGVCIAPQSSRSKPVKVDHTILKPPIMTSVTGMKQAIFSLENSTPEIRDYLINECNLIYECKCCLGLFRSLANFVAHKRTFCRTKFRDQRHFPRFDGNFLPDCPSDISTVIVAAEEPVDTIVSDDFDLMDYCPSLELMKDLGIVNELENRPLVSNLKPVPKKTLERVVQNLKAKVDASFDTDYYKSKEIRLESMRRTTKGVFQTTMGEHCIDLERAKANRTAAIDPFSYTLEPGIPSIEFREKLYSLAPDDPERNVRFPCIKCKKSFGRLHTVVQHLVKTHKYSPEAANKQRHAIKKLKFTIVRKAPVPILSQSDFDDIMARKWTVPLKKLTEAEIKWRMKGTSEAPVQRLPIIPSLTSKLHLQFNGNSPIKGEGKIQMPKIGKSISEVDVLTIDDDDDDDEVTFVIATSSDRSEIIAQDEVRIPTNGTSSPIETCSDSLQSATLPSKHRRKPDKTVISKIIAVDGQTESLKMVPSETMTGCDESISRADVLEAQVNISKSDLTVETSEDTHSNENNIVDNSDGKVSKNCSQILDEKVEISQIKEANEEALREEESVEEVTVDAKSTEVTTGTLFAECSKDPIEEEAKDDIVKMPSEIPETDVGKSEEGEAASEVKVGISENDQDAGIHERNDDAQKSVQEQEKRKTPGKSERKSGKSKKVSRKPKKVSRKSKLILNYPEVDAEISDLKRDVEVAKKDDDEDDNDDDNDDTPLSRRFAETAKGGNGKSEASLIQNSTSNEEREQRDDEPIISSNPDADCEINSNSSDTKLLNGQAEEVLAPPAAKRQRGRKRKIPVSTGNSPNPDKKSDTSAVVSPKSEPPKRPKRV